MGIERKTPSVTGRTRTTGAAVALVLLLAAGCGSGETAESTAETVPTSVATTAAEDQPATSTADQPATTTSTEAPVETTSTQVVAQTVTETSDIVYMSVDGADMLMDVFAPDGPGPWPVVVSFHGCCGDPEGKDIPPTVAVAEAAAAQGMVVFTPTWFTFGDIPLTSATPRETADRVSCAVALAQQLAPEYGGDSARTVVDGFSAGATAALGLASEGARTGPIAGCATDEVPESVSGFVLGDVESWLHTEFFDGAFAEDSSLMQATVASYLTPASWDRGSDIAVHVWTTEDDAQPRPVGDPAAEADWFAARDADGSIQADLERLGQLDDGVVDYSDAAELLHLRLTEAGFESTLDIYPGSHTTLDKVPEIVAYLASAAGS